MATLIFAEVDGIKYGPISTKEKTRLEHKKGVLITYREVPDDEIRRQKAEGRRQKAEGSNCPLFEGLEWVPVNKRFRG